MDGVTMSGEQVNFKYRPIVGKSRATKRQDDLQ